MPNDRGEYSMSEMYALLGPEGRIAFWQSRAEALEAELRQFKPPAYRCPVCNRAMADPPRDFNICPRCGVEFDNDDFEKTHAELKAEWESGHHFWRPRSCQRPSRLRAFLRRLILGNGNAIWERSLTNWNKIDEAAIVADKERKDKEP